MPHDSFFFFNLFEASRYVGRGATDQLQLTGFLLLLEVLEKPWNLILDSKGA